MIFAGPLYSYLFKTALVGILLWLLWLELRSFENIAGLVETLRLNLARAEPFWLLGCAGLMPLNWLAEMEKWRRFLPAKPAMSRVKALQAVFTGVTLSLFTPNRIGEFGGRILWVTKGQRWRAVLVNLAGSMAQVLVTATCGLPAALWLAPRLVPSAEPWMIEGALLGAAGLLTGYFCYFNLGRIPDLLAKWKAKSFKRFVKPLYALKEFSRRDLTEMLCWSLLRYLVYTLQYYCLLRYFGIETSLPEAFAGIATLFLLQTALPLPPLSALLMRGNSAVWLWTHFQASALSSLCAAFVLWIINLLFPALIGTFSLFYVNMTKNNSHENA